MPSRLIDSYDIVCRESVLTLRNGSKICQFAKLKSRKIPMLHDRVLQLLLFSGKGRRDIYQPTYVSPDHTDSSQERFRKAREKHKAHKA